MNLNCLTFLDLYDNIIYKKMEVILMKKKIFLASLLISFISLVAPIKALYEILWQGAPNCYVATEHGDSYLADTYYGTASVRGADRGVNADGRVVWYKWTQIAYDVQGNVYKKRAESYHKDNTYTVVEKITVKDKWNNGPKTLAKWNYDDEIVSEYNAHNISDNTEIEE